MTETSLTKLVSNRLKGLIHPSKSSRMRTGALIIIATLVLILTIAAPATRLVLAGNSITSPLHIVGTDVRDSQGNIVYLRGVNRPSGFTSACTGAWFQNGDWPYGYSYTHWDETGLRQRLAQMQSLGFNVIRCIMFAQWWIQNSKTNLDSQTTDKPFQFCFNETVRIAQEYSMYIVIVPWSSDQGNQQAMPFPSTSIPDQKAFVNFWLDVSNKLKQYPNIIYELYNEPAGNSDTWLNACQATIKAIRANNDNHIIVVQCGYCAGPDDSGWPPNWPNDPRINIDQSTGQPLTNILYSDHIYRYPSGSTLPGTTSYSTYAQIKSHLINHWGYDHILNANQTRTIKPFWIGEIGASASLSESSTGETSYWRNLLQLLSDWGMGYAAWNWDQPGSGWDLQSAPGDAPYPPNQRGQILVDAIQRVQPTSTPTYGLTVNSTPITGAQVTVDGMANGATPMKILLTASSHTVAVPAALTSGTNSYSFTRWEDGSTNPTRTLNLTTNTTITATYTQQVTYSLTVTSSPISGSLVTIDGQNYSTSKTIAALPSSAHTVQVPSSVTVGGLLYNFKQWENGNTSTMRSVKLTSSLTMTATYQVATATMNVVAGTGGTTSPSGSLVLNVGQTYTKYFTATASSGYAFNHWDLNGTNLGTTNPLSSLTVTSAMNQKTLTAVFAKIAATIALKVTAATGGTVSSSGSLVLTVGQSYTFTATPSSGYVFNYWDLSGTSKGSTTLITITATADMNGKTLIALFTADGPWHNRWRWPRF